MNELYRSITRAAIGLGLFAIITSGLIAGTQTLTKERIDEQIRRAKVKALLEVVPSDLFDNDLLNSAKPLSDLQALGLREGEDYYRAIKGDTTQAVILPVVAAEGYTGPIRLIVGIDQHGTVLGTRVIEHKETPGLGDKVEVRKSDWVHGFIGRSLFNPADKGWKVKKDGGEFDQFTGATITPRAVVSAVHQALTYFEEHKLALLATSEKNEGQSHGKQ